MASPIRSLLGLCATLSAAGLIVALGSGGIARAQALQGKVRPATLADYDVARLTLGGDFALTNQNGKRTRLQDFRGRVVVLFFGYTYCPDICPVTLVKIALVRRGLGRQAKKLQPVYVTLDPERDTPARLKAYLDNFEGKIVGLTGTAAEVAQATRLYRVRYEREEGKSATEYLVSHTAYVYVVDRRGKLRYVFPPDVEDALLAEAAQRLVND
jgi:protein SCO1/2